MNFGTHKNNITDLIAIALTKEKPDLIARFKTILGQCNGLFKTEDFTFWLRQLGSMPNDEIPVTKFGLSEALRSLSSLPGCDRHSFESTVKQICERLFTYFHPDDLCPFQTPYHYYFGRW